METLGITTMAMVPFISRFRTLGLRETRSVTVWGSPELPDGEYGFIELYCDEIDCDCQRVLINVVTPTTGDKVWATINYGWEDASFYEQWMHDKELGQASTGIALDPLNPQTVYSPALLDQFRFLIQDPAYVARLQRHYQLFKASLEKPPTRGRYSKRRSRR